MARRPLLKDEERRLFFGIPDDPDGLARQYTFTRSDQDLVAARRGTANQLDFAVQLALLRHPGLGLARMEEPVGVLVEWLAAQLGIPAAALADYAARPQTMTDHALKLATTLGFASAQQRRPGLHDRGGGAIRLEHGSGRADCRRRHRSAADRKDHSPGAGDFLWERAAATADKRRPLNLGPTRVAA